MTPELVAVGIESLEVVNIEVVDGVKGEVSDATRLVSDPKKTDEEDTWLSDAEVSENVEAKIADC